MMIKELMSDGTIREYGVPLRLEEDFRTSTTALLLNPLVFALDEVIWMHKFTPARPYRAIRPTMDISSLFPLAQEMYLTQPPISEVIMYWRLVYSADRKASERIFESTNRCAGDA